ncbi:MAG: hypothetical protein ACK55Z_17050, partial [bacterium]
FLGMAGRYKQPVQYGRESAHKSWAPGDHSSLGDYMRDSSYLRGREGELISGTREKSAVGDSAQPDRKPAACFSSSASFSVNAGISPGVEISTAARNLPSA